MLEDEEWALIMEAHRYFEDPERAMEVINTERRRRGLPAIPPSPPEVVGFTRWELQHLTAGYETFTGVPEKNPNAVWHHIVSLYGPACRNCGKPLRTSKAKFCAACGTPRRRLLFRLFRWK